MAAALLVVLVAAAHWVLLDPWLRPAARPDRQAASMHTRHIALALALAPMPMPAPLPLPLPMPLPDAAVVPKPTPPRSRPAPMPSPAAAPEATSAAASMPARVEAPSASPATQRVPTYPTAPPPSARLHFSVERGNQQGEAMLDWSVEDQRYTLRLLAQLDGRPVLGSVSRGAFDAAGLAPERFVETRRHRELRAANFERDAGEIAFSGPAHRAELTAGAQDRLSWWLQLAAVLQANPALQEVTLSVTGARGDSRAWTFTARPSPADEPQSLRHFHRAAEHAYDTEADVWLDPALHHLPARVRLLFRQGGEATTFTRIAGR